jgi:dihydroxycyclohexadiene carboxylate dehydrogenase
MSMIFPDRFKDKIVIVTGAAQGIGRGVALRIAAENGQVILADRSDLVDEVAHEIMRSGGVAITVKTDLETFDGAQTVVNQAIEHLVVLMF